MKKIFAIVNHKGGVAKTTSTANLGYATAKLGFKTLLIDDDPQANLTKGLGLEPNKIPFNLYDLFSDETKPEFSLEKVIIPTKYPNLYIIPSHIDLSKVESNETPGYEYVIAKTLRKLWDKFDYVFIDTPPSLARLTKAAMSASTHMLIPIQCEYYAILGVADIMKTLQVVQKKLNEDIALAGAFITMYDGRSRYADKTMKDVKGYFQNKMYNTVITRTIKVAEAQEEGKVIQDYLPDQKASLAYDELAKEVIA